MCSKDNPEIHGDMHGGWASERANDFRNSTVPVANPDSRNSLLREWACAAALLACAGGVLLLSGCAQCANTGDVWKPYSATSVKVAVSSKLDLSYRGVSGPDLFW